MSVSSNRAFITFIEVDQRESLILGRQYERLMDSWAELAQLRSEAFMAARPFDPVVGKSALKDVSAIEETLDKASRGTSHEKEWLNVKNILNSYLLGVNEFDGMLASWSYEVMVRNYDQEEFVRSSIPRLENLTKLAENVQGILNTQGSQMGSGTATLLRTVSDLHTNLLALKGLYSPDQLTKLNQPEISRLETMIETRLNEFTRNFSNDAIAVEGVAQYPLLHVVHEIYTFKQEFLLLQDVARNRNFSLLAMEGSIHQLNQSLRLLRNSGMKICLNESDLIWGEVEQDSKDLLAEIQSRFYTRFLFLSLAILLVTLGLILLPSAIAVPLEQLRKTFSMVTPGKGIPAAQPSWVKEISDLEASFQKMVSHINESTSLQTRYFETLTRIPVAFSALYQMENGQRDISFFAQEQAINQLFPLLVHQMEDLIVGQIFWSSGDRWIPCGSTRFTSGSVLSNFLPDPSSRQLLEKLYGDPCFIEWAKNHAVNKPIVINPGSESPSSELKLVSWQEIPCSSISESDLPLAFSGVWLFPESKSAETLPDVGFLLLGFHRPAPVVFSRSDQVFISVIAQQMVALILATELFNVFRKNQLLSVQLEMAKEIQQQALPSSIPQSQFFDLQATIRMANEVGGDFYDFFPFPNGSMGVLIADVSGKNVPAALLTMALKSALYSLSVETMTPKDLVDKLNQIMLGIVGGEHFITMVYVLLDPEKSEMTLCNAGHLPALHLTRTAAATYSWAELQVADFPLGLFEHSYSQFTIPMATGDRLVLYTDGITDCQNSAGLRLGDAGFRAVLDSAPDESVESIIAAIDKFRGSTPLPDDITLLSVCFQASKVV